MRWKTTDATGRELMMLEVNGRGEKQIVMDRILLSLLLKSSGF
jgi:hypothetical protein